MIGLHLRRALRGSALLLVPVAAIVVYGAAFAAPAGQRVVVNVLIALVLVLAIQIFSGNSGIISFGHVAFMGIGAYTAALATIPPEIKRSSVPGMPTFLVDLSLGFIPSLVVAVLVSTVVALLVGVVLTRMAPDALAMATIGILVIAFVVFEAADSVTRGSTGLFAIPVNTTLWIAAGFASIAVVGARWFRESRLGIRLRASRQDAVAAEGIGIDVQRLRLVAWITSGAVMGLGGALWAQYNLAFGPRQFFFEQTFDLLAPLVLGGIGSVSGAVLGLLLVMAATEALKPIQDGFAVGPIGVGALPGLTPIVLALLLLVVLRFRRTGLVGSRELDELWLERRGREHEGQIEEQPKAHNPPPARSPDSLPAPATKGE